MNQNNNYNNQNQGNYNNGNNQNYNQQPNQGYNNNQYPNQGYNNQQPNQGGYNQNPRQQQRGGRNQQQAQQMQICQSCGLPLQRPKGKFNGTEANGQPSIKYCKTCYVNGQFTKPNAKFLEIWRQGRKELWNGKGGFGLLGGLILLAFRPLARLGGRNLERWRNAKMQQQPNQSASNPADIHNPNINNNQTNHTNSTNTPN